ncbi:MAG: TIGR01777 family oxidoreductase [Bacteroidetes bacterium]|nr:TIGR01777 family oxidoreductase [Bacteroidota bacterium]MCL5737360.1 TIGR01777 family oxidoreductase [Bacteroidota bacterium]
MRVIVAGATGFIGSGLCKELAFQGHSVTALTRNPGTARLKLGNNIKVVRWDAKSVEQIVPLLENSDAVVNLVGENISSRRWTKEQKDLILYSRVESGKAIANAFKKLSRKPEVLIQASAVGFYGDRGNDVIDETSSAGEGFLPLVSRQWEDSTLEVERLGIRRVVIRTGVVLNKDGGALPKILLPFKFYFGGTLGSGNQWLPWIHYNDEIASIMFLLEHQNLSGVFNLSSPEPATFERLSILVGTLLRSPSWFPVPSFALRLALGKMADELLLTSQRVFPKRLEESEFKFQFTNLLDALRDILQSS